MLKILSASAVPLGGASVLVHAQTANPFQGQLAAPYGAGPGANNNNNASGSANTPSGGTQAALLCSQYPPNVSPRSWAGNTRGC